MNRNDVLKDIAENKLSHAFKKFPFLKSYKATLKELRTIDFEPVFVLLSRIPTYIVTVIWFIIIVVTYPLTFIPMTIWCYYKAKRMYKKQTESKDEK